MKILDRYLAVSILTSTLLVLGVLLALFSFLQFVEALGDVGKQNYQLADAIRYVLLSVPRQAFEVFPMAALLGTTLGLSALAADAELVAIRAAGVSVLRRGRGHEGRIDPRRACCADWRIPGAGNRTHRRARPHDGTQDSHQAAE
jgi:Lipopolysaccharide export system permease LptF/LptG